MTTQVGIRELKTHLSRYLDEVKIGGTIVITEHGKAIGRIVPMPSASPTLEERMQALQESGFLEWSQDKPEPRIPDVYLADGFLASDLLLEDRE